MPHLFCFGFGYCARALARRLRAEGWRISGTSREADEADGAGEAGLRPFDGEAPMADAAAALARVSHVLVSIPPGEAGDPVLRWHGDDLRRLDPAWLGYLSTTGVYGDRGGGWVDESTPLNPSSARAARRVAAEAAWLDSGLPVAIFRLAGIYGPGRNPLDALRAGRARRIVKPGQVFSRIHIEDIVAVLAASMAKPRARAVYNVCDDEPAPPDEIVAFAAGLLNRPPPPAIAFADADLSAMARSFYADSKRVRNARMKDELGVSLRYPNYRDGLRALLEAVS